MEVKFMWNGIKVDGKLYRAFYSDGALLHHPAGTITIYGRDYTNFPAIPGLNVENDTDIMTDYFEQDRIRVMPDSPHYQAVLEAHKKNKAHNDKRFAGRRAIIAERAQMLQEARHA